MTQQKMSCSCGSMTWTVTTEVGSLLKCYCADCRAAARHAGVDGYVDAEGGVTIFQTSPGSVTLTKGADNLALMRLTDKGLYRWYAGCCGTPVGNTLKGPKFSFVGMVLPHGTSGFGPLVAQVNTKGATSEVKSFGTFTAGMALMGRALKARLTGRWRKTPFFDTDGAPKATPVVLSPEQHAAAKAAG